MVVICGIITIFSINSFRKSIEDDIEKSLRIVASSVNETYTNLYEGDYTKSIDGKIQKGGVALSSNTSLIDGVHGKTGFDVSFIYGDMRVITTIKREAGGKTTGLKIEQELYDSILEGDDIFLTDTEIDVSSYYAYYQPLINSDGTVIGSIEAVTSVDGVKTIIRTQTIKLVLFSAVFLVLAAILVMLLARRMVITMRGMR
jgi:methyl-accepting chemotaxis protein